ncbi:hypothetical protein ACFE04_006821 [Oxalis oulophora]
MELVINTASSTGSSYVFLVAHCLCVVMHYCSREVIELTSMAVANAQNPLNGETTCGTLLQKLQEIWDEVGESDEERDKMLLQIEQECLDVYKRKDTVKTSGTIKEQLEAIKPVLEQLWEQKEERIKEFSDVQSQIQKICGEISGISSLSDQAPVVDESDLTLKKLNEFQSQLQELQKEKSERLRKVLDFVSTVHDLCAVLGVDFLSTVTEVHPSLDDSTGVQLKSISNDTLSRLAKTVLALKEDKKMRLHKVILLHFSFLLARKCNERKLFDHVTCNISASVDEVTTPGALAHDLIEQAEVEVERIDLLKASRMKEIAFKKQAELEEIYGRAHIEVDPEAARGNIMAMIDGGNVEPTELLADMDNQIAKAKEEAFSRKDILDKVEKWMSACEEESWLEDYNRDENRYNASRGAHLNLKRAEKARILVNKIPDHFGIVALVDTLVAKTKTWEEDRDMSFSYDGVPLLAMLDEYAMLRQEREEEKRRMKESKKFIEPPNTEQDAVFSPRPTSARSANTKKVAGPRTNGVGGNGTPPNRRLSLNTQNGSKSSPKETKRDSLNKQVAPVNNAVTKEDDASHVSGTEHAPVSP